MKLRHSPNQKMKRPCWSRDAQTKILSPLGHSQPNLPPAPFTVLTNKQWPSIIEKPKHSDPKRWPLPSRGSNHSWASAYGPCSKWGLATKLCFLLEASLEGRNSNKDIPLVYIACLFVYSFWIIFRFRYWQCLCTLSSQRANCFWSSQHLPGSVFEHY